MTKRTFEHLVWKEVVYPRPFDEEKICEILSHIAVVTPRGPVILEARSHGGYVKHFIGVDNHYITKIVNTIKAHGDIQLYPVHEHVRTPIMTARQLTVSHPGLALKTETTTATIRTGLAALAAVQDEEESVVQVVLGKSFKPQFAPKYIPDPHESWLRTIMFGVDEAPVDARKSIKEKNEQHCFETCIRIGVSGENQFRRIARINSIYNAFCTLESAGVRVKLSSEKAINLNQVNIPWHFPLRLSVKELSAFTLLPFGEEEFPGTVGLHPKRLLPPEWYQEPTNRIHDRTFAICKNGLNNTKLSLSPEDSLEHLIITGPTGSGKSTLLEHLILSDIYAGRSVLVIDPKQDLINRILECTPESRKEDVVVIDPSDPSPVGFNPLALPGDKTLIADAILAVFKEVFSENWGIRSQDILSAALLTLAQTNGASLLEAHYNDAIPLDLLKSEQQKIAKELSHIDHEIKMHNTTFEQISANLKLTLDIVENCGEAYRNGSDTIKKLMNQAIFEKFYISNGENTEFSVDVTFRAPYDQILEPIRDGISSVNAAMNRSSAKVSKYIGIAKDHIRKIFGCGLYAVNNSTLYETSSNDSNFFEPKSSSKVLLVEHEA